MQRVVSFLLGGVGCFVNCPNPESPRSWVPGTAVSKAVPVAASAGGWVGRVQAWLSEEVCRNECVVHAHARVPLTGFSVSPYREQVAASLAASRILEPASCHVAMVVKAGGGGRLTGR